MTVVAPPLIEVSGLGKRLTSELSHARRQGAADIVGELLPGRRPRAELRESEFWALRDVSFEVAPGEALGVIGANGAGKSTLLRLLAGITRPDEGTIAIRGAHAAMLDLGAPFDRILSGRENIETAAAVHGIPASEVPELIDAVAEFSQLGEVLDDPTFTYSTGMHLRLGYGIAAQLRAPVLLVDEVIAVGDIGFQRRCLAHIRGHLARGGAVVLVSHDLWMVQALCQRCVVLDEGRVLADAPTNTAISAYLREGRATQVHAPRVRRGFAVDGAETHATIEVRAAAGPDGAAPRNGDDLHVTLELAALDHATSARWRLDVLTANRQVCVASVAGPDDPSELGTEPTRVDVVLPEIPLLPGTFYLSAQLLDPVTHEAIGTPSTPRPLEVESRHTRLDTLAQLPGAGALSSVRTRYRLEPDPT